MTTSDKYKLTATQQSVSIQPYSQQVKSLFWFVGIIAAAAVALLLFYDQLGEGGRVLGFALIAYLAGHGLYDYLFRINVRYVFDKTANAVYKINSPFPQKRLMALDELVIFTSSGQGSWHYAMGARKKQFLKSYAISEAFGSGKKSQRLQEAYEGDVLALILQLSASPLATGTHTPSG